MHFLNLAIDLSNLSTTCSVRETLLRINVAEILEAGSLPKPTATQPMTGSVLRTQFKQVFDGFIGVCPMYFI